jgi:hypothetical protein
MVGQSSALPCAALFAVDEAILVGPLVGPLWAYQWVHSSGNWSVNVGALVGDDVRELVWNVYTLYSKCGTVGTISDD